MAAGGFFKGGTLTAEEGVGEARSRLVGGGVPTPRQERRGFP